MRTSSTIQTVFLTIFALLSLCATPAIAQDIDVVNDAQITALQQRVADLEQRLADLEELAMPLIKQAQDQLRRDKAKAAARARMRQDRGKYSPEVLGEVEALYQTANKDWRSPAAVAALEKLVNEYPDLNRTGCATMYLGQMTQGDERVDYLTRAMTDFADCYYGDGVNVGAYATYYLACHQWAEGSYDDAQKLIDKINTDHPDAIDHRGRALTELLSELRPETPATESEDDTGH